jgi:hypothetical protein
VSIDCRHRHRFAEHFGWAYIAVSPREGANAKIPFDWAIQRLPNLSKAYWRHCTFPFFKCICDNSHQALLHESGMLNVEVWG